MAPTFNIPDDPLLDEAIAAPSPDSDRISPEPPATGHHAEDPAPNNTEFEQPGRPNTYESDEDISTSNAIKRPRLDNQQATNSGNHAPFGPFAPGNVPAHLVQTSLRQFVPSLTSSKKLRGHSEQELHWFSMASPSEREAMAFALNLEMRDMLETIANAVASSCVHPDLWKQIKIYTGVVIKTNTAVVVQDYIGVISAGFPTTVLNMLKLCQIPNIPQADNQVATQNVLSTIGGNLIDYRSTTKTELAKRKPGAANMDLGSFVANLTWNTNIKITQEHYGRVAFLSREYRWWDGRDKTNPELSNIGLWDWIDKALENARTKYGKQPEKVDRFIKSIIEEDERLFNKAIGTLARPDDRENWQRQVEMASGVLPAIANN